MKVRGACRLLTQKKRTSYSRHGFILHVIPPFIHSSNYVRDPVPVPALVLFMTEIGGGHL